MSINKEKKENHLHQTEAKWFAIYTRYKCEKMVAKQLSQIGIEYYLPIQKKIRKYTRKVKEVELPLIPCYLFVKITKNQYIKVLENQYVIKFIRFANNLISIPEQEINILRLVVGEGIIESVENKVFKQGDAVEIVGGELTGLKGRLIEKAGKRAFLIDLNTIGVALRISIDIKYLRIIKSSLHAI